MEVWKYGKEASLPFTVMRCHLHTSTPPYLRTSIPPHARRFAQIVLLLLLVTSLLLTPSTSLAQDQTGDGRITATVEMGTAGEALPPNLEAELLFLPNGQGPPVITTQSVGPQGSVTFTDLDTAPDHRYLVRVTVDGQEYFSQLLSFAQGETALDAAITVYESTGDLSTLSVSRVNVIAEARDGRWVVATLYVVTNPSDRLVVPPEGEGLLIPTPAEASDLAFQDPEMQEQIETVANGFRLGTRFQPGQNNVVFSYVLPYEPPAQMLELPVAGPTEQLVLLVADLGQEITAPTLTSTDPLQANSGENYLAFERTDVPADFTAQIEMAGLPAETPAGATGSAADARVAPPVGLDERLPQWTPLALIALTVAGIALYLWIRPAPTEAEQRIARRRRREALLGRIAELDDRFEAGDIGEQTYKRQREAARRELKHLLRHENVEPVREQTG